MSATETSRRLRKACLPCIKAKAKCSPSAQRPDECHRCLRLNKQCVFEVVAKKPGPGPKSRSRVRQLEQRVESLIGLIATKNGTDNAHDDFVHTQVITPESIAPTDPTPHDSPTDPTTSVLKPQIQAFEYYDPVDAGILDEQHAYRLVREFKTSFINSFPFVVVDAEGPTLRQQEPFLFHAILAVTAYNTPKIQHLLAAELKRQVARTIEFSNKRHGVLQGLLVYAAWYHSFYRPDNQQVAIIIQLCVALVQDLGYSKNIKRKPGGWSMADCGMRERAKGTLSEKRAYLGAYFLSVAFSQAWRKRSTLTYTRYMSQCCDAFNGSSVPTDVLIRPLIQASELLCRVNEHFSYDDIDNADVKGEILLDMSVNTFLSEMKQIRDSVSPYTVLKDNITVTLIFSLLNISINEVCLHSSLWSTSSKQGTIPLSLKRLKMLHRTMEGAILYLNTMSNAPTSMLYQLGMNSWSSWFYAVVTCCKAVFLRENELLGRTQLDDLPEEIENLDAQNMEDRVSLHGDAGSQPGSDETCWKALTVAQEYNVRELFERFSEKLRFTLPAGSIVWRKELDQRDTLYAIACLQTTMFRGFTKRMARLTPANATTPPTTQPSAAPTTIASGLPNTTWTPTPSYPNIPRGPIGMPFANLINFDSINFDGITLPNSTTMPQDGEDFWGDVMWDLAMDDFTLPSL